MKDPIKPWFVGVAIFAIFIGDFCCIYLGHPSNPPSLWSHGPSRTSFHHAQDLTKTQNQWIDMGFDTGAVFPPEYLGYRFPTSPCTT